MKTLFEVLFQTKTRFRPFWKLSCIQELFPDTLEALLQARPDHFLKLGYRQELDTDPFWSFAPDKNLIQTLYEAWLQTPTWSSDLFSAWSPAVRLGSGWVEYLQFNFKRTARITSLGLVSPTNVLGSSRRQVSSSPCPEWLNMLSFDWNIFKPNLKNQWSIL